MMLPEPHQQKASEAVEQLSRSVAEGVGVPGEYLVTLRISAAPDGVALWTWDWWWRSSGAGEGGTQTGGHD